MARAARRDIVAYTEAYRRHREVGEARRAALSALLISCHLRGLVEATAGLWRQVRSGTAVSAGQRAALRLAATHATTASAQAVDLMYSAGGSTSVFAWSPLQQRLHDVHAVTQHYFVAPPTYETIGRVVLGVEPDGFML